MDEGLVEIEGVLYPKFIDAEELKRFREDNTLLPEDTFILTHPKCGTTLTQQIVHLLRHNGVQPETHMMEGCPWLEQNFTHKDLSKEGREPMMFKSHADPTLFPGDWRVPRLIIVTRNPKDTMVSLYHHMKNKGVFSFDGSWDDFFQMILDRKVESTDFFDWHLPWWERHSNKETNSSLWLHYEDIIADLPSAVRTIADFLGISVTDEVVQLVADQSTLDAMKQNPKADCGWIKNKDGESALHLRKGGKGNWRDVFSAEQDKIYSKLCQERLDGTGLVFDFGEE